MKNMGVTYFSCFIWIASEPLGKTENSGKDRHVFAVLLYLQIVCLIHANVCLQILFITVKISINNILLPSAAQTQPVYL